MSLCVGCGRMQIVRVKYECVIIVLFSSKFHSKLHYVHSLEELRRLVPLDHVYICNEVKRY